MGTAESNHSDLFDIVIEEKIEEIQNKFRDSSVDHIEEIIKQYRQMDNPLSLDSHVGEKGPTSEKLNQPGAVAVELKKIFSDVKYVEDRAENQDDMILRLLCQLYKFNPADLTDDELRTKQKLLLTNALRVIGCKIRKSLNLSKAGFIEKLTASPPDTFPRVVLQEHLKDPYQLIDCMYADMPNTLRGYKAAIFANNC
jgi:hypothetical protein